MPERASQGSEIKVNALRGINLRKAKSQLEAGECDRIFGLYPSATGALSRIPGKSLMRVFEDGTVPRQVLQVAQLFDGTGNVYIQNGDSVGVYSLDELLNRVPAYDLTPNPVPAYGLLGSLFPFGTEGETGAIQNVFSRYPCNTLFSNEDSVIYNLNSDGSFSLALGTYRIYARIGIVSPASNVTVMTRAGLYSQSFSAFKTYYGTTNEILGVSSVMGKQTVTGAMSYITLMGRFQVTAGVETLSIMLANSLSGDLYGTPSSISSQDEIYMQIQIGKE